MLGVRMERGETRRLVIASTIEEYDIDWCADIDALYIDWDDIKSSIHSLFVASKSLFDFGVCDLGVFDISDAAMESTLIDIACVSSMNNRRCRIISVEPDFAFTKSDLNTTATAKVIGEVAARLIDEFANFNIGSRSFVLYRATKNGQIAPHFDCLVIE